MRIEDYALIGDLQTAALVGRNGSMDWLCLPRFDSASCFSALLGEPAHGRWLLAPAAEVRSVERRYRPGTLVLETDHETADGTVRVIDFMPRRRDGPPQVARIVEGLDGRVPMRSELALRPDYGAILPWIEAVPDGVLATAGPDAFHLSTPHELNVADGVAAADFEAVAGSRAHFVMSWHPSSEPSPRVESADSALARTEAWWREWSGRCIYDGAYSDAVRTSLVVLKAMTHELTGALVAAPTTSLPEDIGGVRNWDYRYSWLRDSVLTLEALLAGGYTDEALAFRDFVLRAVSGDPGNVQIMYGVGGERRLTEFEVPHLPGYEGSKPVRIGNAASEQFQLDVYGEVVGVGYAVLEQTGQPIDPRYAPRWKALIDQVGRIWREPDDGIWEARGPRRHYTHSKVMAWVAVDRAVRIAEKIGHGRQRGGLGGAARRDPRRGLRARLGPGPAHLHPVLRLGRARRRGAADPDRGLPARRRRARDRDDRRRPRRARPRRVRLALLHRQDRRRPARRRGPVPGLLVLAGERPRPERAPRRGPGPVRAPPGARQRPRAAGGGVRRLPGAAGGQLPAGVQPPRPDPGGEPPLTPGPVPGGYSQRVPLRRPFGSRSFEPLDLAVDLGTANTLVYVRGQGIVLTEPSVVAVEERTGDVVAVGAEARQMLGRTPATITATRPLRDGVIREVGVTQQMLRHFVRRALQGRRARPRVMICVPSGLTKLERRAVLEAAHEAGARKASLIEEPMAAAIGTGLPVGEPVGHLIVDVGGGTTEVAVIALGGIVASRSIRVGGDALDEALSALVRREHNFVIGAQTAEDLKFRVGSAHKGALTERAEIRGRNLSTGMPTTVMLHPDEVLPSLEPALEQMVAAVVETLEETPPELAADVMSHGLMLAGGGALLPGLDERLRRDTGLAVHVTDAPLTCVAVGAGLALEAVPGPRSMASISIPS